MCAAIVLGFDAQLVQRQHQRRAAGGQTAAAHGAVALRGVAVSPWWTNTVSKSAPRYSAANWAKVVSCP